MKILKSVKTEILGLSLVPAILMTVLVLVTGVVLMEQGMEEEVVTGLLSSAHAYKDIAINITDREVGDSITEEELKAKTGYDFTWFDGDTRKNSSLGQSVIGTKASNGVISEVIGKGNVFTSTKTVVAGEYYMVAYIPVKDESGNVTAMAFAGVSRASVKQQIIKSIFIMIGLSLVFLIIAIILIIVIATKMTKALLLINDTISELKQGKFIKADKYLSRQDEIGDTLNNTNEVIATLEGIVKSIKEHSASVGNSANELADTANQISHTADDVSNAVQEIASGAAQQADEVQQSADNAGKIGDALTEVNHSADTLKELSDEMKSISEKSSQSLAQLKDTSIDMTSKIDNIYEVISKTQEAINNINDRVDGIENIATQTNLLSLNASIEAARAGEAGNGFAVVAEEIGTLASNSKILASEIRNEMNMLLEQAQNAVLVAKNVQESNSDEQSSIDSTYNDIDSLISSINKTVDGVDIIRNHVENSVESKNVVVAAMESLSAISEENAASAEETGASMEELNATVNTLAESASSLSEIANNLNKDMEFFKI